MLPLVLTLLLSQGYAPGREGTAPLDSEREARVMRLGKELRCPTCQGSSIADSPASVARAQLDKVRELVAEGKSDDEIKAYFVARYGEFSLMRPATTGTNGLLWALPVVFFVVGLVALLTMRRAAPRPMPPAPNAAPQSGTETEDEYLAAVRAEVKK